MTALSLAEASSAVLNIITSAEQLRNGANHRPGGFNDWEVLRNTGGRVQQFLTPVLDRAYSPTGIKALLTARIAASTLQVIPFLPSRLRGAIGVASGALSYGMSFLHNNGGDGSDQISFLVPTVTGGGRLIGTPRSIDASLWGLAIQGTMSYAVSGWVKLFGESWRSGGALEGVMRTRTFGSEAAWRIIKRYPAAGRFLENMTLTLECAFPGVYLFQRPMQRLFFVSIMLMHLSIAVVMGLGRFVPAFFSFQGPFHYVTTRGSHLPHRRHNDVLYLTSVLLGVVAVGGAFYRLWLQRSIAETRQEMLTVDAEATVRVPFRSHIGAQDAPLLVFQNGLLSTKECWLPLTTALPEAWGWVIFDRPGYDGTDARQQSVLADPASHRLVLERLLAEADAEGREVWLVGHSLGGLLSSDARFTPTETAVGQILIDPSIYQSAARSSIQEHSTVELLRNMKVTEVTNRIGFGWLLKTEIYAIDGASEADMSRLDLIYRLPGIWRIAREEWILATRLEEDQTATAVPAKRLVISSSQTATGEGVVFAEHTRFADAAEHGEHFTLPFSTHDSMILRSEHASAIAEKIVDFITTNPVRQIA